ncbi:hypothetical protein CHLNCDRAFT_143026 [Chlorella variabilis]|uniref:Expansin-like EG45 domain-containing protein n=1 Tax=Chlorella variabilis TaxID=554065 RepID=E1Z9B8_CHLVA|nr:hypothetical protein CHLNCDRAFT_143026 [Chlorella variabilis]EFN57490.1 hypothetical protein CHLNCDRAFT_143026 [Chlorella variabilis]|eukprot:XP_005849592.1 hypothetical protein CHLNCDRAFT_143026 [Chlorella variabilis]
MLQLYPEDGHSGTDLTSALRGISASIGNQSNGGRSDSWKRSRNLVDRRVLQQKDKPLPDGEPASSHPSKHLPLQLFYAAWGAHGEAVDSAQAAVELGSCGLDTAGSGSGTRAFAPSLALGPANPFVHCLTMAGCGACFEVQCGNDSVSSQAAGCFVSASGGTASINVTVMDACPGCRGDLVALPLLALSRLAPVSQGEIAVRYRQIACQPPSNIVVVVEGFSLLGDGWLRLHLEHVAGSGGIKALWSQVEQSGAWRQLSNVAGTASWQLSGVPPAPLDLLIYPADGAPLLAQ